MEEIHLIIRGKVQGVWYTQSAKDMLKNMVLSRNLYTSSENALKA